MRLNPSLNENSPPFLASSISETLFLIVSLEATRGRNRNTVTLAIFGRTTMANGARSVMKSGSDEEYAIREVFLRSQ